MEIWLAWFSGEGQCGPDVKAIAEAAEELGYAGVALSDHVALPKRQTALHPIQKIAYDPHIPNPEPISVTATMAAVTRRLRFMTYAYVMGMREPFSVAKQAGALSDLSQGRFALGITPGWQVDEIALLGHDPKTRGKRFGEALEVIQGLWKNDLFSYAGSHYQFQDVGLSPRPVAPPDILVGGHSPASIRRAAKHSGWIGMNHSVEELTPMLDTLEQLSNGKARKYVIPAVELSDALLKQFDELGVTGIVVMPWPPMQPDFGPATAKIKAMTTLAQRWIRP